MNQPTKLQRSPDACWGTVESVDEHQLVLWSPTERRLRVLNRTAASVWNLFGRPLSRVELIDSLSKTYGAPPEVVEGDVAPLVDELIGAGFLCDSNDVQLSIVDPAPTTSASQTLPPGISTIGPFQALGSSIVVAVDDVELHHALSEILDPLLTDDAEVEAGHSIEIVVDSKDDQLRVVRNGEVCAQSSNREHILRSVLAEVNTAPLEHVQSAVVLHAAGATLPGSASSDAESLVVFPGVSNAGKSTLVTQLCLRGHAYLTDEAVAIAVDSLEAQPFHKSICVEFSAQQVLGELSEVRPTSTLSKTWDIDPRRVGLGRLAQADQISAFVFPKYILGGSTSIEMLEPFETLQCLIANAFDFASVGQPAFDALVRLANRVPAFALEHGGDGTQLQLLSKIPALDGK